MISGISASCGNICRNWSLQRSNNWAYSVKYSSLLLTWCHTVSVLPTSSARLCSIGKHGPTDGQSHSQMKENLQWLYFQFPKKPKSLYFTSARKALPDFYLPGPSGKLHLCTFLGGTGTFTLLIRRAPEHTVKYTPELISPPSDADLSGGEALGEALFRSSDFMLHPCSRKQSGWAPAINAFSSELCKATPAQHICPQEVNPRRTEVFTNLLLNLCFWDHLSTRQVLCPDCWGSQHLIPSSKKQPAGLCPVSLANSNDNQIDTFPSRLVYGARIRDSLASTSEFLLYLLDELFNTAELLFFQ